MADPLTLNAAVALAIVTSGFAVLLLGVSLLSWRRLRARKFLAVGLAFLVLAVKGAYEAYEGIALHGADLPLVVGDFLVLAFLYLSVAAR